MKATFLAIGLSGALGLHDFFVSILTIRHRPETRTLDLTWRITAHDIEHALESVAPLKLGSPKEHPKADSLLNAYFKQHLVLFQEKQLTWNWIGKELDGETLYCYLQVEDVPALGALTVHNTLLQDLFDEQQNVVHLEAGGKTRSHSFLINGAPYTFRP